MKGPPNIENLSLMYIYYNWVPSVAAELWVHGRGYEGELIEHELSTTIDLMTSQITLDEYRAIIILHS